MADDRDPVIRPELGGWTPAPIIRRKIVPGQVWAVDESAVRWFVLTPERIIALFAGGEDHTTVSLVHTYGDRLYLISDATNYRSHDFPEEWALASVG